MKINTAKIFFLLLPMTINVLVLAESPSEEEMLQLEEQIRQQEAEQERQRQRAAEEVRRKAEEQKLKEERAQLEEEKRRLEAEKQAELQKRQQEEKAKRLAEEQRQAAEEAEKQIQFEQYMEEADSAMKNKDYEASLQAYTKALEVFPDESAALSGQSLARKYLEVCNSIVGEWDWFLASVTINNDNTMNAVALIPNNGTWECTDPELRKFTFRWAVGGWVDKATLSEDGNKIDAVNNIGMGHQAWRKGTKREEPASSKNPIYGN